MANVFPTPEEINEAMDAVNAARGADDISDAVKTQLEQMSNTLQDIQDAMIEQTEQALVDALASNNKELLDLTDKINQLATDLDKATATLKTVSSAVGALTSVLGALV